MQRSKFCSVGAISKIFERDFSMFYGVISIVLFASITNLVLNQYKFGFEGQPIAHNDMLWNFLGMTLAGLCFSLSYGCPGKHLVQMGAGNLSSAVFVLGMGAGDAISHNFVLESSGAGITVYALYAVATPSYLRCLRWFFHQKGVIKFDCFCRFLLIKFEVKFWRNLATKVAKFEVILGFEFLLLRGVFRSNHSLIFLARLGKARL